MSDGHSNMTTYGYDDVFDEPSMGWARYAHTVRTWLYNSRFFYIRPTVTSIELLGPCGRSDGRGTKFMGPSSLQRGALLPFTAKIQWPSCFQEDHGLFISS
ncbi:unnamed protein product [Musa textilis]